MGRVLSRAGVYTAPTIGKHIFCLWPLDAEAQAMAKALREWTSLSVPVFGFRFAWIFPHESVDRQALGTKEFKKSEAELQF